MDPVTAPLGTDDEADTPSGTRTSGVVDTVVRWCALGAALTLAGFLGVWLLK